MSQADRQLVAESELDDLARALDVPTSKYEEARTHYNAIGSLLDSDDELGQYHPVIYPQGSFLLRTVTKPIGREHYDIDAVCVLSKPPADVTQQRLKELVGAKLKASGIYGPMLDPEDGGRRCWTINYAESSQFHLDLLPAIPDDPSSIQRLGVDPRFAKHAIMITDRTSWETGSTSWPRSNPKGYEVWFREQSMVARHDGLQVEKRATIEQVPGYGERTPLQRAVQLLKRHRDVKYGPDPDKPISIIITTLAARSYSGQESLADAIRSIASRMKMILSQSQDGRRWYVANPVNPNENFADKWVESPRKHQLFVEWLDDVELGVSQLLDGSLFEKRASYIEKAYRVDSRKSLALTQVSEIESSSAVSGRVRHRRPLPWALSRRYTATINAEALNQGHRAQPLRSGERVPKHWSIKFSVATDAPTGAHVYWQVVNTGNEASRVNGLRGQYFRGQLTHEEATLYEGTHWIQCFLVHHEQCVARTNEFVVNI